MAAQSVTPVVDLITLREGVAMLSDTGYPVSERQLRTMLAGCKHERHGGTYYYRLGDIWAAHRDHVDRLQAR